MAAIQWVLVPSSLRVLTGGKAKVRAQGKDILGLLEDLEARYPGFKAKVCQQGGKGSDCVNIFVNGRDIRSLQGVWTPLQDEDEVYIIPAIAGESIGAEKPSGGRFRGRALENLT